MDPTVKQSIAFARACGVARFTWNWTLAEWDRQYKAGEKPTANKLKLAFNAVKGESFPWVYDSPRDANSGVFPDLQRAFRNFFEGRARRPKFKKKGQHDSFYLSNDKFRFRQGHVRLPVIGDVRTAEPLRLAGRVLSGRVFRRADHWYLSAQVEGDFARPTAHPVAVVGLDFGLKTAIVASTGETFESPKPLRAALRKLARANRRMHRKVKGSKNRAKARRTVARVHERVANIRNDWTQKVTTAIAKNHGTVVVEDLNVKGMTKLRSLARALSDVGLGTIRRMLDYKQAIYGHKLVVANRWFPSSKTCSKCGTVKKELALSERTFCCESCGFTGDRDLNAALNLETYPRLAGNETPVERPALARKLSRTKLVSAKQELCRAHL